MKMIKKLIMTGLFAGLSLTSSCTTIAQYDQVSYEKATAAKAEALMLVEKATTPYNGHKDEVEKVSLEIEKAYEYDKGRKKNSESISQWEILKNPDGNLFGGFVRRWKDKGTLKPDYVSLKKPDIGSAFDQIIELETGKRK